MNKQDIIEKIKEIASQNDGKAPGSNMFSSKTGLRKSQWYPHLWLRWSDAITESGLEKNKANEIFQILNNAELEIYKEAMENGQLYGSINIKEIVTLIKEQKNLDISAEKVETKGQLKNTGISKVFINLHAEVIATINLNVKPKVE